ncbi:hypothetical protein HZH68_016431 [Vespula germanica]|uniref:Uncharacterized protein n=1 Tax=Vespula germanica TaxID=30212 RepID=A0A834J7R4_VESGE|nr:hypothetical protein HZH68_016431 [Vespula germanica]
MRVAQLLLWCVLLEDYGGNLGRAAITSDSIRQDAASASASASASAAASSSSSATNPTLPGSNHVTACDFNCEGGWKEENEEEEVGGGEAGRTGGGWFPRICIYDRRKVRKVLESRDWRI